MKALIIEKIGNIKDAVTIKDIEKPICQDNEVLVRMIKSTINPADTLFVEGKYRQKPQPNQVIGFEGVGIIEDVNFCKNLLAGMLVAFRHQKVWAEYVSVPYEKITVLPQNFPIDKAAQLSLNLLTAEALILESGLQSGDWLVLTAGASAVSKLIIQLCKKLGVNIISIIRDSSETNVLKQMGAKVILKTDDNIKEIIPSLIGNNKLQAVIDAVGGSQTSDLIKMISPNGNLLLYGLLSYDNVNFHNADIIFKNLSIRGFGIDNWLAKTSPEDLATIKQSLIDEVQKDNFLMPTDSTWEIENYKEAFCRLNADDLNGKVLLSF